MKINTKQNNKNNLILKIIAANLLFLSVFVSQAFGSGDQILEKVDETMNAPKSSFSISQMILVDSSGNRKEREMMEWSKKQGNKTIRLIKFVSPKDVKDVGFLTLEEDQMYLWLPEFGKVRRIASSAKNQNFMGSDLSYDDLSTTDRTKHYSAKIIAEDDKTWTLLLTRKPNSDKPYPKTEMVVSKESYVTLESKMYDESGNLWKTMKIKPKKVGKYWTIEELIVEDKKTNHKTIIINKDTKFDIDLSDEIFTQRTLKKQADQIK